MPKNGVATNEVSETFGDSPSNGEMKIINFKPAKEETNPHISFWPRSNLEEGARRPPPAYLALIERLHFYLALIERVSFPFRKTLTTFENHRGG